MLLLNLLITKRCTKNKTIINPDKYLCNKKKQSLLFITNDKVNVITYIIFFGFNIGNKLKFNLHFSDIWKHESNDLLLSFSNNKKREMYQNNGI